jgi:hypothetical protein
MIQAMPFALQLSVAALLVVLTLSLQSVGMAAIVVWVRAYFSKNTSRLGLVHCARLMIRATGILVALQLFQVVLWAGFYRWQCLASWDPAFYFSATSYSTVGYGDVLLPSNWRMLGPIEAVVGALMSGLSASVLFAIVVKIVRHEERFAPPSASGLHDLRRFARS